MSVAVEVDLTAETKSEAKMAGQSSHDQRRRKVPLIAQDNDMLRFFFYICVG